MSIRMQIPYREAIFKSREIRAKLASPDQDELSADEIEALEILTKAKGPYTPALIAWKHCVQDDDGWVPGGFIDYILMEKVPGISLRTWPDGTDREEGDQLRAAFKRAWLLCIACGLRHADSAKRNLIWDREKQICYIVDWEYWVNSHVTRYAWDDWVYRSWEIDFDDLDYDKKATRRRIRSSDTPI